MSGTRKPTQNLRSHRRKPRLDSSHHTCIECPACGTETCKTLQQLGMYCDTAIAATEAVRAFRKERTGKRLAVA